MPGNTRAVEIKFTVYFPDLIFICLDEFILLRIDKTGVEKKSPELVKIQHVA